mmetsp:Transcript_38030/g.63124  ORF Transcript_38030/g.63124 Transcript_38030/m.63124 type:complete len:1356 (+) Transcript_38030:253-4320(+)
MRGRDPKVPRFVVLFFFSTLLAPAFSQQTYQAIVVTPGCQLLKSGQQFIQLPPFTLCANFTIEGYFKVPTTPTASEKCARLFEFGNGEFANNIIVGYCTQPYPSFKLFDATATRDYTNFVSTSPFLTPVDTWFHLALRCKSSGGSTICDLLFDGIVRATQTYPLVLPCITRQFQYIGRSNYVVDPFINLWVSSFRVWGSALNDATLASVQSSAITSPQPGLVYFNNFGPANCPVQSLTGCVSPPIGGCTLCVWGDPHVTGCDLGTREIMYVEALETDMMVDTLNAGFIYRARGGLRQWAAAVQTEVSWQCRTGADVISLKAQGSSYVLSVNGIPTTLTVAEGYRVYTGVKIALLYSSPPQVAVQCTDTTFLTAVVTVRTDGNPAPPNTYLSVCVHVPQSMYGLVRGLAGAPNCDPTDDVQFCNGTKVALSSLREPFTAFNNPILSDVQRSWQTCVGNSTLFPNTTCSECGGTPRPCDTTSRLYLDGLALCSSCNYTGSATLNIQGCAYDYCLTNGSIEFLKSNCDEGRVKNITDTLPGPIPPCNSSTTCNGRGSCTPLGLCDCTPPFLPPNCGPGPSVPNPTSSRTPVRTPTKTSVRTPSRSPKPCAGCLLCVWGDPHVTGCDLRPNQVMYVEALETDMLIDSVGLGYNYRARGGLRAWLAAVQTEISVTCRTGSPTVSVKAEGSSYVLSVNGLPLALTVANGYISFPGVRVALAYQTPEAKFSIECTDTTLISHLVTVRSDGSPTPPSTYLAICVNIPTNMMGKVRGLVGEPNCDGSDDIQFCNGTTVNISSLAKPYNAFVNPILSDVQRSWQNCGGNSSPFPNPNCTECGGTPTPCDTNSQLYKDGLELCANCNTTGRPGGFALDVEGCAYDYCLTNGSQAILTGNCDEGPTSNITIPSPSPTCDPIRNCNGRGSCTPLGLCDCTPPFLPPNCGSGAPPTPSRTSTRTSSRTPSRTSSRTPSRTSLRTPSRTSSRTPSRTSSRTPSRTAASSISPSRPPTRTSTRTPVPSITPTTLASATWSATPPSSTPIRTPSSTVLLTTPTQTSSATARPATPTQTSSASVRPATPTQTSSASVRPATPTQTLSATLRPATPTQTSSATARLATPTQTSSASVRPATPTTKPATRTSTPTLLPSVTSLGPIATKSPSATIGPTQLPAPTYRPQPVCSNTTVPSVVCGFDCCPVGAQCCGVNPQQCCIGGMCCDADCVIGDPRTRHCCETCVAGNKCTHFSCLNSETCCGQVCCPSGSFCGHNATNAIYQVCCPQPLCGETCCAAGQKCLGGQCVANTARQFGVEISAATTSSMSTALLAVVVGSVVGGVVLIVAVGVVMWRVKARRSNTGTVRKNRIAIA